MTKAFTQEERAMRDRLYRDVNYFTATWVNEVIDATIWTSTDPVTNPNATVTTAGEGYTKFRMWLVANETGRLVSAARWKCTPNLFNTNTTARRTIVEFEMNLTDQTNLDNTATFWGLSEGVADTAASNDIIGFMLAADVLQTITDNGGSQEVNTTFSETLSNWNKFRIDIQQDVVIFYLNDTLIATHEDVADLPDEMMYLNFYCDTEGGAGPTHMDLGWIRVWHEDVR